MRKDKRVPLTPPQVEKLREGLSAQSRGVREREAREARVREMRLARERVRGMTVISPSGLRMHLREAGTDAQGNQLWAQIPMPVPAEAGPWMPEGARA